MGLLNLRILWLNYKLHILNLYNIFYADRNRLKITGPSERGAVTSVHVPWVSNPSRGIKEGAPKQIKNKNEQTFTPDLKERKIATLQFLENYIMSNIIIIHNITKNLPKPI